MKCKNMGDSSIEITKITPNYSNLTDVLISVSKAVDSDAQKNPSDWTIQATRSIKNMAFMIGVLLELNFTSLIGKRFPA